MYRLAAWRSINHHVGRHQKLGEVVNLCPFFEHLPDLESSVLATLEMVDSLSLVTGSFVLMASLCSRPAGKEIPQRIQGMVLAFARFVAA